MAETSGLVRTSIAAGAVAALAAAYFLGGSGSPDVVNAAPAVGAAAPAQSPQTGAAAATSYPAPGVWRDTVSVAGTGRVVGTPDTMLLQMGVETRGADVATALDAANAAISKVSAALKANGVATADIKTSGLGVRPEFRYENKPEGGPPTIAGYVATESLSVKLRDLGKAGAAISAAVAAGGNNARVDGASLDLEGSSALVQGARAAAFADAKAKAEQYAKLSGRKLGSVSTITERVHDSPPVPVHAEAAAAGDSIRSVPIQPGSADVAVNVQVIWSLES